MNIIQAMNRLRSDIQTWVANNLKVKVNTELKTDSTEVYKVLSDNNFTDADKDKVSNLATVATSGSYNDLINKPTIPPAQVNSDWNATSGVSQILNKPTIPDTNTVSNWGFTKTNGTVTKVSTGDGLTGGDITDTGTIKCNLLNFTRNTSAALASDSDNDNRLYPVSLDKDGKLSVKVPWVKVSFSGDNEELNEALSNYVTKTDIDDYIPALSGGKTATTGKYVSGVTVSGHTVTVTQADLPEEQYKGTVTSVTPGTGLTGGAITTSGTINLKTAATGEIGGIKAGSVSTTSSGANKTINANKFAVHVDKDGLGYVAIPEYSNNLGDITGVTAGNGLTGGAESGNATLNVGAGAGISVGNDSVAVDIKDTTKNSKAAVKGGNSDKLYAVELDKNGDLAVSVPWTATTFEGNSELEALLDPFALKTDLDAYKTKQDAKSSPTTTNSTSTEFIDTISQDANGVITATKKKLPDYAKKSDIPTVNNATLTVQKNGATVGTFTANQSTAANININVPTKVADLSDGSSYATQAWVSGEITKVATGGEVSVPVEDVKVNGSSVVIDKVAQITVPDEVTDTTVSGWGFTKNTGTVTSVTVNGENKTPDDNGLVDLGKSVLVINSGVHFKPANDTGSSGTFTNPGVTYDDVLEAITNNIPIVLKELSGETNYCIRTDIADGGGIILYFLNNYDVPITLNSVQYTIMVTVTSSSFAYITTKKLLQQKLTSGTNIKTINGNSLLGSGDITITASGDDIDLSNYATKDELNNKVSTINNIEPTDGNINITDDMIVRYAVCDTTADSSLKLIELEGYTYIEGSRLVIRLNNGSAVPPAALQVNNSVTGIYYCGYILPSGTIFPVGHILELTYGKGVWNITGGYQRNDYINGVRTNINSASATNYGACDTVADDAAKAVNISGDFSLVAGAQVVVKFTKGNTSVNTTLNVNNTGAKMIRWGSYSGARNIIHNAILTFVYDGEYWFCKSSSSALTSGDLNSGYSLQVMNDDNCGLAIAKGSSIINGQGDLHIQHYTNENAIYCSGGNIVTNTGAIRGNIVHNTRTITETTTLDAKDNIVLCNNTEVINVYIKMNQILSGQVFTIIKTTNSNVNVRTISSTDSAVRSLILLDTNMTSVTVEALSGIGVWNLYCIGDYIYLYKQ